MNRDVRLHLGRVWRPHHAAAQAVNRAGRGGRAATAGCTAVGAAAVVSSQVQAATRTWNGGGADDNWGTAANWGGTAPAPWDDLVFGGSTRLTPSNNLAAGRIVGSVSF